MNVGVMELPIYSYVKFEAMDVNFSCNDKVVRKIAWHKCFLSKLEHWTLEGKFIFWQFASRKSSKYVDVDYFTQKDTQNKSLEILMRMWILLVQAVNWVAILLFKVESSLYKL